MRLKWTKRETDELLPAGLTPKFSQWLRLDQVEVRGEEPIGCLPPMAEGISKAVGKPGTPTWPANVLL